MCRPYWGKDIDTSDDLEIRIDLKKEAAYILLAVIGDFRNGTGSYEISLTTQRNFFVLWNLKMTTYYKLFDPTP